MALPEIECYVLEPKSEPETDVEEEPHGQLQGHTVNTWTSSAEPTEDDTREHETGAPIETDVSVEDEEEEKAHDKTSDEEWAPQCSTEEDDEDVKKKTSSEVDCDEGEEQSNTKKASYDRKNRKLCTDCGSFHYTKNHKCEHKTKPYVCNICGKRCVAEFSLKLHSNIHSETYEHYCKYCYSPFKTKTDKLNHEQTHQSESKPYKCLDCEETFASLQDRRKHRKSHEQKNKFSCDICGLTIGRKHRPRHMMIHTGAKPYQCSICERTFNQASHLKSHMRLHTGERPYKCHFCDKAFNHKVSLKSHVERYHPLGSGDLLDKIEDGSAEMQDEAKRDSGDNDQKQDIKQTRKPKGPKYCRTGRPPGRPKRSESQINDNSFDSNEESQSFLDLNDLIDFHQKQILKKERNMKRKRRSRSSSESEYDPNEEIHTGISGKKNRARKI